MQLETLNDKSIAELVKLGRVTAEVKSVSGGNVPFVMVPEGYKVQMLPECLQNDLRDRPHRVKQNVTVLDPASFINYYHLFADSNSRVFGDEANLAVSGIIDYHAAGDGAPRWCSHQVRLMLRKSEQWKIWETANNKKMTQVEFAEFLEQHSMDVSKPSPAEMMEIANDLQAHTEVEFGSGIRQQDGQVKFKYTESTKTSMGGGQVSVPDRFIIQTPPFVGGDVVPMEALLRFRVNGGKLQFWFTLIRPDAVIRTAFYAANAKISTDLSLTIIYGAA